MKKIPNYLLSWLLATLTSFCLLSGCSKKSQKTEKRDKKVLKLNFVVGDAPSLNPHDLASTSRGLSLGKWLFEGLTRLSPDGEWTLAGAADVTISPCQTRYQFTLRPNAYSDGTPVLASDYEESWKRALAPNAACSKAYLFYPIKHAEEVKKGTLLPKHLGVKALDDKTLLIELIHPAPYFLNLLSNPIFAPFKLKGSEVLTNGPYSVNAWKKDALLSLKVSPHFWDCDQIKIKRIRISSIKDGSTAFYIGENQEIDWIGDPFSPIPPDLLISQIEEGKLLEVPIKSPFWIYLNTKSFPLTSPLIRRALSAVLDRTLITNHIYVGNRPLFSFIPESVSLRDDPLMDNNLLEGKELFKRGMEELGLNWETFPTLTVGCCPVSRHKRLAEYLQERWQEVFGIRVDLDVQEWNIFYDRVQKGDYQIGGAFTSSAYDDPLGYFERLAYSNNFSQWENAAFKSAIQASKQETNPHLRAALFKKAELILKEEMPIISIAAESLHYSHRPDLKGVAFDHVGIPDLRWATLDP